MKLSELQIFLCILVILKRTRKTSMNLFQSVLTKKFQIDHNILKGQCQEIFSLQVFFTSLKPLKITYGSFQFFLKFSEIFTSQGAPPVSMTPAANFLYLYFLGGFFSFRSYNIQHCFIRRPSDSTVPTDAGIEPRTSCNGCIGSQTL